MRSTDIRLDGKLRSAHLPAAGGKHGYDTERLRGAVPGDGGRPVRRGDARHDGSLPPPRRARRMPGLYLAGGSVHPGAGIPMAALSGRMAAARLLADFASTNRSSPGGYAWWYVDASAMTAPMDSR